MSSSSSNPVRAVYRSSFLPSIGNVECSTFAFLTVPRYYCSSATKSHPNLVVGCGSTLSILSFVEQDQSSSLRIDVRFTLASNILSITTLPAATSTSYRGAGESDVIHNDGYNHYDELLIAFADRPHLSIVHLVQPCSNKTTSLSRQQQQQRSSTTSSTTLFASTNGYALAATAIMDFTSILLRHSIGATQPLEEDLSVAVRTTSSTTSHHYHSSSHHGEGDIQSQPHRSSSSSIIRDDGTMVGIAILGGGVSVVAFDIIRGTQSSQSPHHGNSSSSSSSTRSKKEDGLHARDITTPSSTSKDDDSSPLSPSYCYVGEICYELPLRSLSEQFYSSGGTGSSSHSTTTTTTSTVDPKEKGNNHTKHSEQQPSSQQASSSSLGTGWGEILQAIFLDGYKTPTIAFLHGFRVASGRMAGRKQGTGGGVSSGGSDPNATTTKQTTTATTATSTGVLTTGGGTSSSEQVRYWHLAVTAVSIASVEQRRSVVLWHCHDIPVDTIQICSLNEKGLLCISPNVVCYITSRGVLQTALAVNGLAHVSCPPELLRVLQPNPSPLDHLSIQLDGCRVVVSTTADDHHGGSLSLSSTSNPRAMMVLRNGRLYGLQYHESCTIDGVKQSTISNTVVVGGGEQRRQLMQGEGGRASTAGGGMLAMAPTEYRLVSHPKCISFLPLVSHCYYNNSSYRNNGSNNATASCLDEGAGYLFVGSNLGHNAQLLSYAYETISLPYPMDATHEKERQIQMLLLRTNAGRSITTSTSSSSTTTDGATTTSSSILEDDKHIATTNHNNNNNKKDDDDVLYEHYTSDISQNLTYDEQISVVPYSLISNARRKCLPNITKYSLQQEDELFSLGPLGKGCFGVAYTTKQQNNTHNNRSSTLISPMTKQQPNTSSISTALNNGTSTNNAFWKDQSLKLYPYGYGESGGIAIMESGNDVGVGSNHDNVVIHQELDVSNIAHVFAIGPLLIFANMSPSFGAIVMRTFTNMDHEEEIYHQHKKKKKTAMSPRQPQIQFEEVDFDNDDDMIIVANDDDDELNDTTPAATTSSVAVLPIWKRHQILSSFELPSPPPFKDDNDDSTCGTSTYLAVVSQPHTRSSNAQLTIFQYSNTTLNNSNGGHSSSKSTMKVLKVYSLTGDDSSSGTTKNNNHHGRLLRVSVGQCRDHHYHHYTTSSSSSTQSAVCSVITCVWEDGHGSIVCIKPKQQHLQIVEMLIPDWNQPTTTTTQHQKEDKDYIKMAKDMNHEDFYQNTIVAMDVFVTTKNEFEPQQSATTNQGVLSTPSQKMTKTSNNHNDEDDDFLYPIISDDDEEELNHGYESTTEPTTTPASQPSSSTPSKQQILYHVAVCRLSGLFQIYQLQQLESHSSTNMMMKCIWQCYGVGSGCQLLLRHRTSTATSSSGSQFRKTTTTTTNSSAHKRSSSIKDHHHHEPSSQYNMESDVIDEVRFFYEGQRQSPELVQKTQPQLFVAFHTCKGDLHVYRLTYYRIDVQLCRISLGGISTRCSTKQIKWNQRILKMKQQQQQRRRRGAGHHHQDYEKPHTARMMDEDEDELLAGDENEFQYNSLVPFYNDNSVDGGGRYGGGLFAAIARPLWIVSSDSSSSTITCIPHRLRHMAVGSLKPLISWCQMEKANAFLTIHERLGCPGSQRLTVCSTSSISALLGNSSSSRPGTASTGLVGGGYLIHKLQFGVTIRRIQFISDASLSSLERPLYIFLITRELSDVQQLGDGSSSTENPDGTTSAEEQERQRQKAAKDAEKTQRQVEADLGGFDLEQEWVEEIERDDYYEVKPHYGKAPSTISSSTRDEIWLIDGRTWDVLDIQPLQDNERALSLLLTPLTEMTDESRADGGSSAMQLDGSNLRPAENFVVVGTGIVDQDGEDVMSKGNVILYRVINSSSSGSGENLSSLLTTPYLTKVYDKEILLGPANSVASLVSEDDGGVISRLVIGAGAEIAIEQWGSGKLTQIGFFHAHMFVLDIQIIKNFFLLSDAYDSLYFLVWREWDKSLTLLAKDYQPSTIYCTGYISNGSSLAFACHDMQQNIQLFQYAPKDEDSRGGNKLVSRMEFHLGTQTISMDSHWCCSSLLLSSATPVSSMVAMQQDPSSSMKQRGDDLTDANRFGLHFGTIDGGVSTIIPVSESVFWRLSALRSVLANAMESHAGLSTRLWRLLRCSFIRNGCIDSERKTGIVDGDIIVRYLDLPIEQQEELASAVGTTSDLVLDNLLELEAASIPMM